MPLMTKIRESLATFFSIFAGLFVIYIVLDWGMDITGRRHSTSLTESQQIGKIDGQPILAKDFAEMLRRGVENQKAQSGTEPDEDQQRVIRDQIWSQLVDQALFDEEVKRFGINVTDQEIIDWVKGDNPPEFLKQRFTDSTGTFHRQEYEEVIMNPKNKDLMVQVEDFLRKQREREKLQSLVMASVQVDEADIKQRFMDQNIKYEADCTFLDPNVTVRDDEVKVSDDDLRQYYNEHSADFKIDASRKLKYVLFAESPSKSDSASVLSDMEDVRRRAEAGVDFKELASTYSETPPTDTIFHKHGELPEEEEEAVFAAHVGAILGPVEGLDGYHLIKVLEFRPAKDEFIRASHILINTEGADSVKALREAKDVLAAAKRGADFAELARTKSGDRGSAAKGGDLGWFGKGRMVKPFEDAAFNAKVGQIVGPVRSQFGYHIIEVVAKDNREARFIDIHMPIQTSSQTRSEISQQAQDFAYLAKQGSFDREAEQSKYKVVETLPFEKDAVIPAIGSNTTVNKFAFKNKVGSISEAVQVQGGYGVFTVSEVKDAGIRPFEEVKTIVDGRLKRERKTEKTEAIASQLRQSLSPTDSLAKLAALNPKVSIQHLAPFTLAGYIPGIGRDQAFLGGVSALSTGEVSRPIEGSRGVYLIKLLSKSAFDSTAYVAQRESLRTQLLNERKSRFFTSWEEQLKKAAEIVDNRDLFYR